MIIFCSYWWSVSNLYNSKRSKLKAIIQILWDSELLIYLKQLLITSMNFIEFFRMRAVLKPEIVAKTQHALQPLNSQLRGLSHTSGLPESQNIRTCLTFQCIWRRAFLEAIGLVRNGRVSVWALIQHHGCQPRCINAEWHCKASSLLHNNYWDIFSQEKLQATELLCIEWFKLH